MPAAPAATSPSVLSPIDERRASDPAVVADVPSPVQQSAARVGPAPLHVPLPTTHKGTHNNEESTQSTGRIDTIDEVVIIDGTLKEADDVDNNTNEEEEREDRQK